MSYADFLARKRFTPPSSGLDLAAADVSPELFAFQRHIVAWAVRRGRAAVWADTGLGKTRIQVEWLRQIGQRGLILAPLGVTAQTRNGRRFVGVELKPSYYRVGARNLAAARARANERTVLDELDAAEAPAEAEREVG